MQDLLRCVTALRVTLRLLVGGLALSGCMVEPARNPGAKAAERAAARHSTGDVNGVIAKSSAVSAGETSRLPAKLNSGLTLTLPRRMSEGLKQVQVTLDPKIDWSEYECSQGVANRVLDHLNGSSSAFVSPESGGDTPELNRYLEKFDAKSKELRLIDLAPGRYVLTVELLGAVDGPVFGRGETEVVIIAGALTAIEMDFEKEGSNSSHGGLEFTLERPAFQSQQSLTKQPLFGLQLDADLVPYSSVCSVAEWAPNQVRT